MDPNSFSDPATGHLIAIPGGHAFVPVPPPRELTLSLDTQRLLERASRHIGELNGVGYMLSTIADPAILATPLLYREAASSSRIEGTRATVRELYLFDCEPTPEAERVERREVLNYISALRSGLAHIRSGAPRLGNWSLRHLHQVLFSGTDDPQKQPGEFRSKQCVIGSRTDTVASARFVPPPPDLLADCLVGYEHRLAEPSGLPEIVELALLHYYFETLHPFADGNGRIGRILISLHLCASGTLIEPLLILSPFFERNRREYVDRMLQVSQRGAWEEWVSFFALAVVEQAQDAIARARHLLKLRDEWLQALRRARKPALLGKLVDSLFQSPATNATLASEALGVSRPTAMGYLQELVRHGIVVEIRFDKRQKWFFCEAIPAAATDVVEMKPLR